MLKVSVQDASTVTLSLKRPGQSEALNFTGSLTSGEVRFPWFTGPLELRLKDAAGNTTVQLLELDSSF